MASGTSQSAQLLVFPGYCEHLTQQGPPVVSGPHLDTISFPGLQKTHYIFLFIIFIAAACFKKKFFVTTLLKLFSTVPCA